PEGFELASYWDEWSRSFEASRPQVEVKIRASELVRRFLPGELQGEDGVYVVVFENLDEAFRELLKFGPDAEVLEPAELRERVATAAGEGAALYGACSPCRATTRVKSGRPPPKAGAEAMEPQDSASPGLFFLVPIRKERHVSGRDEALPGERAGDCPGRA